MKAGDVVTCQNPSGYQFTEGKEYTILKFEPRCREEGQGFTWPAYVHVIDDRGEKAVAHASRFTLKEKPE